MHLVIQCTECRIRSWCQPIPDQETTHAHHTYNSLSKTKCNSHATGDIWWCQRTVAKAQSLYQPNRCRAREDNRRNNSNTKISSKLSSRKNNGTTYPEPPQQHRACSVVKTPNSMRRGVVPIARLAGEQKARRTLHHLTSLRRSRKAVSAQLYLWMVSANEPNRTPPVITLLPGTIAATDTAAWVALSPRDDIPRGLPCHVRVLPRQQPPPPV